VENLPEVLPRFFRLSKLEAKEVVAELSPTPAPTRTVVTSVRSEPATARARDPEPHPELTTVSWLDELDHANPQRGTQQGSAVGDAVPPRASATSTAQDATVIEPKTPDLSRIHVTVSREVLRKLDAARDALSHSHPRASDAEILEAALDLLLERSDRRKGLVAKPRSTTVPEEKAGQEGERASRYIPAGVRRAVWKRDGGRCQWPLEGGGICGSTFRIQLHHKIPWARGGPTTVEDLMCACDFHNDLAARQDFGDAVMDRFTG
jgi:5-methylcytosine-specific restriction endonuclease McrA